MPDDLDAIIEHWRTLLTGERFVVRDELGTGGMGRVDRVHDPVMLRETALKRVPIHQLKGRRKRSVLQEAQISSQLQHPGVIPMHEVGVTPSGELFLDMKLIEGQTLTEWILDRRHRLLEPYIIAESLAILVKVCDTVAYAHSRGVLHLDLKPDNIMVSDFGAVYVVDWGLARLVEPDPGADPVRVSLTEPLASFGSASGTPRYMAPEQAEGRERTRQTDVFLLGGLLYFCLVGRSPYSAAQMPQLMQQVMSGDIETPEQATDGRAPIGLSRIAAKALSFDSADRYQSIVELQTVLKSFLRGAGHLREIQFRQGEDILVAGETSDAAYIIVAGHCEVSTGTGSTRRIIRQMGPGEVFGELALLTKRPRGANVRAITPVVTRVITQQSLTDGLALDAWAGQMVRLLASRFSEVDEELRSLQRKLRVPGVRFDKPPRR